MYYEQKSILTACLLGENDNLVSGKYTYIKNYVAIFLYLVDSNIIRPEAASSLPSYTDVDGIHVQATGWVGCLGENETIVCDVRSTKASRELPQWRRGNT